MTEQPKIQCAPDGPLLARGLAKLTSADGATSWPVGKAVALCRCGRSANKPFCDGAHRQAGFDDSATRPVEGRTTVSGGGAEAEVCVHADGPYEVRGGVVLEGYALDGGELWLCRCGRSKSKPFCDGSHQGVFEG